MVPTGRELSELLSPHPVPQFVSEYWAREPLYIRGTAAKFSHFGLDLDAFERLIRARTPSGRLQVRFVGPDSRLQPPPRPLSRYSVRDRDLTVGVDWISDAVEALVCFCAGLKAGLSLAGSVFMTG